MNFDEFLAWEDRQELRWEFDGCSPLARTGGTNAHALIQANLIGLLFGMLEGGSCRAYGSELKLRTETSVRYPDALILCSRLPAQATVATDATVVFEILSKRSAVDDLGAKAVEYRTLPSLQRYVVLHQTIAAAQVFARDEEGGWAYDFVGEGGALDLGPLAAPIPLAEHYAGVELTP
jgi:Uma2 family endonuclease